MPGNCNCPGCFFGQVERIHRPHQWFRGGREHVDPLKEANAQATRLSSHTTTLAHEYARQGKDWETELRQRAKEVALMTELGLPAASKTEPSQADTSPESRHRSEEDEESEDAAA